MAELQRLIYRSVATGTTDSLLNVATILAESQRNNDRDGLTGVLAAHGDRYIQVIEGSPSALDNLLRRLEGDWRHKGLDLIDRRDVDRRRFDGWAMAHARVTPENQPVLEQLMTDPQVSDTAIIALLETALANGSSRSSVD
ncbi:MAG: BLUF domain-containing protein [Alphaproteobacteria bacterium]|nr:BLUF domain-containing protein [Alphaproteobacteria bacterium]MBU2271839.1 BLUF domain-containing protein [Alphaproteobacteria bacterium]MBU2418118.1 BLUF domain-containing protein [Alphaproteobacteria bacterium]